MQAEVLYRPTYALARIRLDAGETISAEAGAMVSMSPTIQLQTEMRGGLLGGLKRGLTGESFFINTFQAAAPGEVTVAPSLPGDIEHLQLAGHTLFVQSGSYIASGAGIQVDSKWGGAKAFFSGEGLLLLRVSGSGDLFLSSYGAIHHVDLGPGEQYVLDTGHMVAFTEGMGYNVRRVGGWKSTLLSGEGLVVDVTGPGRLYMQTRSPGGFLAWLIPQLPKSNQ